MKKIVALVILLAFALTAPGALADEKDLYIDRNVQRLFTSEDGLLSTSTQAIAQTSDGFIWIGGYGGLVRYDGKHFETFAYKRITRVSDLAAGEDGVLWVATSDKGLFRCEDNTFEPVPGEDGGAVLDVTCMAFSPDGRLMLGTASGLCVMEGGAVRRLDIPELSGQYVDRLLCPTAQRVLCVTREGGLYAWEGGAARRVAGQSGHALRSLCHNPADDTYLVGTAGSEVLVLDDSLEVTGEFSVAGLTCINDLYCGADGALWLCADNGIGIYVDGGVRRQNLRMDNSVDRMLVDHEGNYWFVSSRQGVLEVSRSQFGDVSRSAGLDSMVVNAIQRIGDTLYIGHDAGLVALSATDFKQLPTVPLPELAHTRVRSLLADDGRLWIGTMKKGLYCYDPAGATRRYSSATCPAMRSDNIRSITRTGDGVLVGTDVGAYLVSGDEVRSVTEDPDALAFRILSAVQFGDTICLGSDGSGLYLVKDGQVVRRITTGDGLSSDVIMKVYWSDARRGLWLVTGNDIDFLDADGGITSVAGFPSTNNLDLLMLANGDLWVLTGSGIYRTTEESMLEDGEPRTQQFRRADGLPYEVTPNSYQCVTEDAVYVCGSGGVFSLQTDFADAAAGDYRLVVDSVAVDGEPVFVRPGETFEIAAGVKRIDINAFVLTYQAGNPTVFYRLEGFDEGETVSRLSDLGDISYTNLNGGSYTFHYGVRDYETGEVLSEITLPIVKRYSWYQQPAVQTAMVALGLLVLAGLSALVMRIRYQRATRALQQEYEQKQRDHLQQIAYQDYLTGLYNRNYLAVWNERQASDPADPVTFVSIDLNDLKKVNDSHGHKYGDQLLCEMSGLLKRHFSGEKYAVMRIGGDEFLVLARGADSAEVGRAMEAMTAEAAGVRVSDIPVTFAYGMCTQRAEAFDFEAGLRESDLRLLENKDRFHGRTPAE